MRKMSVVVALVFVWIGVFVTSWRTPLMCDDNTYALEYCHGPERGERFRGKTCDFQTIKDQAYNLISVFSYHYRRENGRFLPAIPLRLFAGLPHWCYAITNATMFVAFCILLFLLSGLNHRWFLSIVGLTVFFLIKADAVFWMAAAINYLWPVVGVMACAVLFIRSEHWRCVHGFWCAPLAFILAGGHEIISVPLCLSLGVFWIRRWIARRRLVVNVPFLMTLAFGLGTTVIFLSPVSPLFRAGYEGSSSLAYLILCKVMTISFAFVGSPALIAVLCLMVASMLNKSHRFKMIRDNFFSIILLGFSLLFTVGFGNLGARASWPVNVLSFLVFLRLAPSFMTSLSFHGRRLIQLGSALAGVCVLANTTIAATVNGRSYDKSFRDFFGNPDFVFVVPQRADWLFGFMFDRTPDPRGVVQIAHGEACTNGNLARRLDRPCIIGLFESDYRWLKGLPSVDNVPLVSADGAWHGDANHDLLVRQFQSDESDIRIKNWAGIVEYRTPPRFDTKRLFMMFGDELRRNYGGAGIFRTQVFFEHFARDVIYATLYKSRPLKGFFVYDGKRTLQVLIHNRFAYREQVVGVH